MLNPALSEPILSVMNFLNEVKINYPDAISFSAGRPAEEFFFVRERIAGLDRFLDGRQGGEGLFGQYGRTNGLICDQLAAHLERDENIHAKPDDIVVTTGCQEAMALVLIALLRGQRDVLLTADPTYIGITGLARLLGIALAPVSCGENGIDLEQLDSEVRRLRAAGKQPRAVYVIPDFNNPLGYHMPLEQRERLLALADELDIWILEDNPYGMFNYDGDRLPTLKALDRNGRVIYLGTFSKTLFPSLRVGFLVSGEDAALSEGGRERLSEAFSKIKSLTTVNTSAISQGIVGGVLEASGGTLRDLVRPAVEHYRVNRDTMLQALESAFAGVDRAAVSWNRPAGGFFLTLFLPFAFDDATLRACADEAGVIVVPMSYFSLCEGREYQVRLSFCSNTPEEIEIGIARLAAFIKSRM
jgi:(S)-3,5-dihydroxyphenylglycine transaminase